jgi:PKD repeat protein
VPSTAWTISVSVEPRELTVGSTDPATVTVDVRRADNNEAPASGTTIVLSTTLGDFDTPGSGLQAVVLGTINGRAQNLFFPGSIVGTALLSAQLEASAGQASVPILAEIEPVAANFTFVNSNQNLSVQFQNTSTGDPTKFLWDFGDGTTSNEEHPVHIFPEAGDWVVSLTASKKGSSDTFTQIITVTRDPLLEISAGFEVTIDGLTAVFRDTSTGEPTSWSWNFGDGGRSGAQHPVHTYGREGSFVVSLTASNSESSDTFSQTITVAADPPEGLFITAIKPNSGPDTGGTAVTISGTGFVKPLRVSFGGVLATVTSSTQRSIKVVTPPASELGTEVCDDDDDGDVGVKDADTAVDVQVELSAGPSQTVSGGFTYTPTDLTCRGD